MNLEKSEKKPFPVSSTSGCQSPPAGRRLRLQLLYGSPCFSGHLKQYSLKQYNPGASEGPGVTIIATEWSDHSRTGCGRVHESNGHL